jgi:hypothetical protein
MDFARRLDALEKNAHVRAPDWPDLEPVRRRLRGDARTIASYGLPSEPLLPPVPSGDTRVDEYRRAVWADATALREWQEAAGDE